MGTPENKSTPRSHGSLLGSAFAAVKSLFTPERAKAESDTTTPNFPKSNLTLLGEEFANLKLNDSNESFLSSGSRTDDSFKSVSSNWEHDAEDSVVETNDNSLKVESPQALDQDNITIVLDDTLTEDVISCTPPCSENFSTVEMRNVKTDSPFNLHQNTTVILDDSLIESSRLMDRTPLCSDGDDENLSDSGLCSFATNSPVDGIKHPQENSPNNEQGVPEDEVCSLDVIHLDTSCNVVPMNVETSDNCYSVQEVESKPISRSLMPSETVETMQEFIAEEKKENLSEIETLTTNKRFSQDEAINDLTFSPVKTELVDIPTINDLENSQETISSTIELLIPESKRQSIIQERMSETVVACLEKDDEDLQTRDEQCSEVNVEEAGKLAYETPLERLKFDVMDVSEEQSLNVLLKPVTGELKNNSQPHLAATEVLKDANIACKKTRNLLDDTLENMSFTSFNGDVSTKLPMKSDILKSEILLNLATPVREVGKSTIQETISPMLQFDTSFQNFQSDCGKGQAFGHYPELNDIIINYHNINAESRSVEENENTIESVKGQSSIKNEGNSGVSLKKEEIKIEEKCFGSNENKDLNSSLDYMKPMNVIVESKILNESKNSICENIARNVSNVVTGGVIVIDDQDNSKIFNAPHDLPQVNSTLTATIVNNFGQNDSKIFNESTKEDSTCENIETIVGNGLGVVEEISATSTGEVIVIDDLDDSIIFNVPNELPQVNPTLTATIVDNFGQNDSKIFNKSTKENSTCENIETVVGNGLSVLEEISATSTGEVIVINDQDDSKIFNAENELPKVNSTLITTIVEIVGQNDMKISNESTKENSSCENIETIVVKEVSETSTGGLIVIDDQDNSKNNICALNKSAQIICENNATVSDKVRQDLNTRSPGYVEPLNVIDDQDDSKIFNAPNESPIVHVGLNDSKILSESTNVSSTFVDNGASVDEEGVISDINCSSALEVTPCTEVDAANLELKVEMVNESVSPFNIRISNELPLERGMDTTFNIGIDNETNSAFTDEEQLNQSKNDELEVTSIIERLATRPDDKGSENTDGMQDVEGAKVEDYFLESGKNLIQTKLPEITLSTKASIMTKTLILSPRECFGVSNNEERQSKVADNIGDDFGVTTTEADRRFDLSIPLGDDDFQALQNDVFKEDFIFDEHNPFTSVTNKKVGLAAVLRSDSQVTPDNHLNFENTVLNETKNNNSSNNINMLNGSRHGFGVLKEINDNIVDRSVDGMGAWLGGNKPNPILSKGKIRSAKVSEEFNHLFRSGDSISVSSRDSLYIKFDPLHQSTNPVTNDSTIYIDGFMNISDLENPVAAQSTAKSEISIPSSQREEELKSELNRLRELYQKNDLIAKENSLAQLTRQLELDEQCESALKILHKAEERVNTLTKRLHEIDVNNEKLSSVALEYQNTVESLTNAVKKQRDQQMQEIERMVTERDSYRNHLESAEAAFIDVFSKYEKLGMNVPELKRSQQQQERQVAELQLKLVRQEERLRVRENAAAEELATFERYLVDQATLNAAEITRMKAQLRKSELAMTTIQDSLDKKTFENQKLANICDDLIAGRHVP